MSEVHDPTPTARVSRCYGGFCSIFFIQIDPVEDFEFDQIFLNVMKRRLHHIKA